ncbi:hypothetical protein DL771_000079 [Monosporascus sp. 5C6A]|nr:hypothetical protein DL771_000079 [Monosporascus sp. 5C6A]
MESPTDSLIAETITVEERQAGSREDAPRRTREEAAAAAAASEQANKHVDFSVDRQNHVASTVPSCSGFPRPDRPP